MPLLKNYPRSPTHQQHLVLYHPHHRRQMVSLRHSGGKTQLHPHSHPHIPQQRPPHTPTKHALLLTQLHLLHELKSRTKPLSTVLHSLSQWFQDNPIPNFDSLVPISDRNPWNTPLSEFSTSSTQPVKLSYPTNLPNKPPTNRKPYFHRHTLPKPKPKKHNLIQLNYATSNATSVTHYFSNTFNIIPPP